MLSRRPVAAHLRSVFPSIAGACALATALIPPAHAEGAPNHTARHPHEVSSPAAESKPTPAAAAPLPPLPPGVEQLRFTDFFKTPVGPRGLEMTDRLRALDGKRVRILGYMVHEDQEHSGDGDAHAHEEPTVIAKARLLLTEMPCLVSLSHYGLCDDLPPQTVYVTVPMSVEAPLPFTPGLLLLTGRLSVGQKTEEDGRVSLVRLALDSPKASPAISRSTQASNQPKNP